MRIGDDRVDGLLRGAVGSLAGLLAMGLFFRTVDRVAGAVNGSDGEADPGGEESNRGEGSNGQGGSNGRAASNGDPIERHDAFDDISVAGVKSREDEPATATVGRLAYEATRHEEPSEEMKQKLGQAVHWGYGILLGGVYGALRTEADGPDLKGGLGYGTAAWVFGDELMVPLLGLAEGPTAHPWTDHAKALGAHLVYGAATATATQALKRVM